MISIRKNFISKPEICVYVNQLESLVQKGESCILLLIVFVFKTRTAKHKRAAQVSVVFDDELVHVVQYEV